MVMWEVGISEPTIVNWYNMIRDIPRWYLQDHQNPIGGISANLEPIVVEIDESLFVMKDPEVFL